MRCSGLVVVVGALVALQLGAAPASAATAAPVMDTSNFVCGTSGACEAGPGNVGTAFAAGLDVFGDGVTQSVEKFYGDDFSMHVISGSLPPGLQLSLPSSEWTVTGTPSKAGTYGFTVQFTPTQDAPTSGPSGTQQLTITIGAGNADRIHLIRAIYSVHTHTLQVAGYDANAAETFHVSSTQTGTQIGTLTESSAWNDGGFTGNFSLSSATVPASVTVTDSLGGSATMVVTVNSRY